ncbi:Hypothetical predicted protein [Olea europaea subsp. europaea]|uniref:Uncharacterized protein n=1 Tax=Olea europaea subsp. europaea TaxID=158383 RepID=A0A8S0UMT8_OLEEU|nr:Hypothetical predicted protein [Olea europaea subsp. europaea]
MPRPCTEINSLKGNIISSISKVPNENKNTDALDLCKDSAVSKSVIQVYAIDNDISDCCNEIDTFKDSASSGIGKMRSENKMDPILIDPGRSRAVNHIEIVADVYDEIDSSKENVISGTPNIDSKKKCFSLVVPGRSRVAEVIVSDAGDGAMGSSKISSKNEKPKFIDLDKGKGLLGLNAEANDELVNTFVTKIMVPTSETGGNGGCDGNNCNGYEDSHF